MRFYLIIPADLLKKQVAQPKAMKVPFVVKRFAAILLLCSLARVASAQEVSPRGVRYSRGDDGRVVSLRYFGSNGLRLAAPKDSAHIQQVEIPYGTTLTSDDVCFLSTLEGVSDLSMGGNLQSEYVTVESSLLPLGKMKHLQWVFLCKRDMQDEDLAFVAELPKIEYLEFLADTNPWDENGVAVTDGCAKYLRRAKSLRHLLIYWGDNLTDQFVSEISKDLEHLEHLEINSGRLTDHSLLLLANRCAKLKWLDAQSNLYSDKGVGHLAKAEMLEKLYLRSDSLSHQCVASVAGLVRLQHLELTVPTVKNEGVRDLADLPNLELLALRHPPLTDEQFAMFENHPSLESAFLNGRDLTVVKAMRVIKTIPKLRHIEVGSENRALQNAIYALMKSRQNASRSAETGGG